MSKSSRRNVTLSLNQELVAEARDLGLDLSAVADAALATAVAAARNKAWNQDKSVNNISRRSGFSAGGPRLAGWQSLQPGDGA